MATQFFLLITLILVAKSTNTSTILVSFKIRYCEHNSLEQAFTVTDTESVISTDLYGTCSGISLCHFSLYRTIFFVFNVPCVRSSYEYNQ